MNVNKSKAAIATAAITGVLVAGGASIALANTDSTSGSTTSTVQVAPTDESGNTETEESQIAGTIEAPADAEDAAEQDALQKLATVSEADATSAAVAAVPGTADKVSLDDKDGFVVWEVDVTQADGSVVEVLVDAGDGSILAQEVDGVEGDETPMTGSIPAPAEVEESEADEKAADAAELAALEQLATVSEADATSAAIAAVPGTAGTASLDDEDGFVVWEVEVAQDDGSVVEVLVDAGDGSVLAQEVDDDGDDD